MVDGGLDDLLGFGDEDVAAKAAVDDVDQLPGRVGVCWRVVDGPGERGNALCCREGFKGQSSDIALVVLRQLRIYAVNVKKFVGDSRRK